MFSTPAAPRFSLQRALQLSKVWSNVHPPLPLPQTRHPRLIYIWHAWCPRCCTPAAAAAGAVCLLLPPSCKQLRPSWHVHDYFLQDSVRQKLKQNENSVRDLRRRCRYISRGPEKYRKNQNLNPANFAHMSAVITGSYGIEKITWRTFVFHTVLIPQQIVR